MCLQCFFYITEVPMQQNQVLSQSAREKRAIEKELMRDPPVGHMAANVLINFFLLNNFILCIYNIYP